MDLPADGRQWFADFRETMSIWIPPRYRYQISKLNLSPESSQTRVVAKCVNCLWTQRTETTFTIFSYQFSAMENEIFVLFVSLRIMLISIFLYEAMQNLCDLLIDVTPMKCFNLYRDIFYLWNSYLVCRCQLNFRKMAALICPNRNPCRVYIQAQQRTYWWIFACSIGTYCSILSPINKHATLSPYSIRCCSGRFRPVS